GYARAQPRDPSTLREPQGRGGAPQQMNEDRFKHKPRIEKLGVKAGTRVALIAVGDKDFSQEVRRVAEDVTIGRAPAGCDIIFFGAVSAKELVRVATLKTWMKPNGALWVIREGTAGDLRARRDGRGQSGGSRRREGRQLFRDAHRGEVRDSAGGEVSSQHSFKNR